MTYSHEQDGPVTKILRDGVHIATYDPVAEDTTYVKERYKKYQNLVKGCIRKLNEVVEPVEVKKTEEVQTSKVEAETEKKAPPIKAEEPKAEKPKEVKKAPPVEAKTKGETAKDLRREVMRLKIENAHLKDEVAKLRGDQATSIQKLPERFSDVFDDSEGAHLKGITQGDLTPEYIAWAKKNMPKEIFDRRYHGRLRK